MALRSVFNGSPHRDRLRDRTERDRVPRRSLPSSESPFPDGLADKACLSSSRATPRSGCRESVRRLRLGKFIQGGLPVSDRFACPRGHLGPVRRLFCGDKNIRWISMADIRFPPEMHADISSSNPAKRCMLWTGVLDQSRAANARVLHGRQPAPSWRLEPEGAFSQLDSPQTRWMIRAVAGIPPVERFRPDMRSAVEVEIGEIGHLRWATRGEMRNSRPRAGGAAVEPTRSGEDDALTRKESESSPATRGMGDTPTPFLACLPNRTRACPSRSILQGHSWRYA